MASKGGCVNGTLVTESYTSPVPLVGLYIAVTTSVCFICMTYDLVYGFFKRKTRPYLPCRWFRMNAFTLTVLAVATKIPNDLVTIMPRLEDQLSKLTGTALMCTAIAFYMPSMGTVKTSERYGNLTALSVIVITMVINVCIQIHTGVIFVFTTEHIIIMVCLAVLLLLMWSSAIALRDQIDHKKFTARHDLHDFKHTVASLQGLRDLIERVHTFRYKFNPQTMLCRTANHHTFGLLCAISLAVVLRSMVRYWVAPGSIETCITADTVSDYKWSIPVVIWSQFLTILMGSSCIIYRWYSLLCRLNESLLKVGRPQLELENLRLKSLPPLIRFLNKKLFNVPVVAKDFFIDYVLIPIQFTLYTCNIVVVGMSIHYVIHRFFHEYSEDSESGVYMEELKSYLDSSMRDCGTCLLSLISKSSPGSITECASFMGELEATGKEYLPMTSEIDLYEYRVSCVSVLVLSRILQNLIPSNFRVRTVMESLKESFEIIYFVDQRTHASIWDNERRWMSTQEVWGNWQIPAHWFQTEIISKLNLRPVYDLGVLRDTLDAIETYFQRNKDGLLRKMSDRDSSMTEKHMALVSIEFAIICKFLQKQSLSAECPSDFLEMCFARMLCFTLSKFPLAILKEIEGDPDEIGKERIRKAFKYCYILGHPLSDKMQWFCAASTPARAADEEA